MMCSTAHNVLEVHLGLNATLIFSCMMMMSYSAVVLYVHLTVLLSPINPEW